MSEYTREQILRLIEENKGPEGLDLSGKDLLEIDLSGVDLHGAILARADLSEADLRRANLGGADLSWAVLQEADLRWADLRGANLHRADLRMARVRWADLGGAQIEGADFSGVDLSEVTLAGVQRGEPIYTRLRRLVGPLARLKPRLTRFKVILGSVIALIILMYLWGWLYKAFYLEAFDLPWTSILIPLSADYPIHGLQVVWVSLGFLSMLILLLLYILLMMTIFLLIPLASILYVGDRLLSRLVSSKMIRWWITYALFLAYFAILFLIFPPVIRPLLGWFVDKGIFVKEGFRVFQLFLANLPTLGRVLFFFSLALLSIPPIWIIYRFICQGLSRIEAQPFLQSHFPWLIRALASLKGARLFRRAHPLTLRERYLALFWAILIIVTLPAFLTQAGKLRAQGDICDGGSLPQLALYSKGLTPPSSEESPDHPQYCLRLLLAKDDIYYVFYPSETMEVEGEMRPKVYEVPADDVFVVRKKIKNCWTCLDTPSGERPPVIISSLVTPTAATTITPAPTTTSTGTPAPTAASTGTPSPQASGTPVPTETPQLSPTFTQGPPLTPTRPSTPSPTRPAGGDDYEPDNVVGQANWIALGQTQTHSFCPDDDIDLIKFPVKERHWYHVYTHDLAMGVDTMISVGLEPTIAIFCNPPNCANDDVAPANLASDVVFQAAADGIAWVTIDNRYQHGSDKTYKITVEEIMPTPTLTPSITPTPTQTLTPTPTPTEIPPKDPWEPNDTYGKAYGPLISGQAYKGYISSSSDKDYFWFEIQNLETIAITLEDMGEDSDYDLYLFDANMVEIERSAAGSGQDEEIIHHPATTGKYYILVYSRVNLFDPSDDYTLKATYGTATPTPTATPTETPTLTPTPVTPTLTPTATDTH